jgi:hypothetical protein
MTNASATASGFGLMLTSRRGAPPNDVDRSDMMSGTGALVAQGRHAGENRRSLHGRKAAKNRLGKGCKYIEMSRCDCCRPTAAPLDGVAGARRAGSP